MGMRRRRRNKPLEDASPIIYRALCKAGLTDQAKRVRILQTWAAAVGPSIGARTAPQSFRRGVLLVKAATPTWQNELVFLRAGIVARLNELLGKSVVRELKIVSGTLTPADADAEPSYRRLHPSAEDRAQARAVAAGIADEGVRVAFERALAKDRAARRS